MPICKKCNQSFPNRIKIEGKIKNLQNRKYCLDCSPFGQHNTRKLHFIETSSIDGDTTFCICKICNREYTYSKSKNHTYQRCNSCLTNERRYKRKIRCIEYKGGKCEFCGYDKCVDALCFHHKNFQEKEFNISGNHCITWERVRKELDKCMILCMNCHTEIHSIERNKSKDR